MFMVREQDMRTYFDIQKLRIEIAYRETRTSNELAQKS